MMTRDQVIDQVKQANPTWEVCPEVRESAVRFFPPDKPPLMIALHPAMTSKSVEAQLAHHASLPAPT